MDGLKHNAPHKYPWEHPETPDLDLQEPTEDLDDLDDKQLGPMDRPEESDYDQTQPI